MFPSNNLFALIRAFDITTPPAKSKEEFRTQGEQFLDAVKPYAEALSPYFRDKKIKATILQFQFDALLSVAYDIGTELFFDNRLHEIIGKKYSKNTLFNIFTAIPVFEGTLRHELAEQMHLYKMSPLTRREIEYRLFIGAPVFEIGRCKDPSGSGEIIYAPNVLHPFFQFLYRIPR